MFCRLRPAVVAVLILYLLSPALAQKPVPTAVVHLKILFPASTDDLGVAEVSLFKSQDTGKDYAAQFRENTAKDIPYGIYHLRARQHGFWSDERKVVVYQPTVWVVMGLQIGTDDGPMTWKLLGTVRHLPSAGPPVWVRLASVYSSSLMDAKVEDSGSFSMAGLPQDKYVLIIWTGTKVLHLRQVDIPVKVPLVVDLAQTTDKR